MVKESILGSTSDRAKTDLRLPRKLMSEVDVMCAAMGVPKNAFFVIAASNLLVKLSPLLVHKRRKVLLDKVENLFQTLMAGARKTA